MIRVNATSAAHGLMRNYPNFIEAPLETFKALGIKVYQTSRPIDELAKHYHRDNLHGVMVIDREGRGPDAKPVIAVYIDSRLFPKTRRRSLLILMGLYLKYVQTQSKQDVILFENFSSKQPSFKERAYVDEFLHALVR